MLRMRDELVWGRSLVCIDSLLYWRKLADGWGDVVKDSLWTKIKKVLKRSMM